MHLAELADTQQAVGGDATIGIVVPETIAAEPLMKKLWEITFRFEKQFSRFLPDSELSLFNANAGMKTPVSEEFAALLKTAQQLAELTDGLCNPFVLPALQRAGHLHSAVAGYENDPVPDYSALSLVDASKLEVGDNWARIPHGTALDIGGFGKGYLADALGAYAREQGATGYWIELSGDIATYGRDAAGNLIAIAVQDAHSEQKDTYIVVCPSEPFGVATSGTLQRDRHRGRLRGHHIIDPRTGKAAETDIRLATLCAGSALYADALASCATIVGSGKAPGWLAARDITDYLIQTQDSSERAVPIQSGSHIQPKKEVLLHA